MKPVTGFYLECNHLVAAITADRPCPTCAAIAQAVEAARAEALEDAVKKIKGEWFKVTSVEKEFLLGIRAAVDVVEDLAKGAGGD